MTVHHCPSCVLSFRWKTELEAHLRDEHPEVEFVYPAANSPEEPGPVESIHKTSWRPTYPVRRIP